MDKLAVLFDVDNTLLNNDLVRERLEHELHGLLGGEYSTRFWEIYEEVRADTDLVNFPETLRRFVLEYQDASCVSEISRILYLFPFKEYLYTESLAVIRHVSSFSTAVILSDGDEFFQRYKIRSAGLEEVTAGRVLIYVHKEKSTDDIKRRFPAEHYVIVDDKPRIHTAMKMAMDNQVTTVMVRQGKYAHDPSAHEYPAADITIDGIGELLRFGLDELTRPPVAR